MDFWCSQRKHEHQTTFLNSEEASKARQEAARERDDMFGERDEQIEK